MGPAQGRSPTRSYEDFDFKIPVGTVGDNYDRYRVRMAEMRESVKIIDQALDGLPEGDYITSDRKYALPPRHELATSMEALIHHFKLVTEGFRVPPGEAYYPIESPRGELGCFVRADGSSKPARVHMRDPSFVNLQALQADGAGPLHRRPDRRAGHARPDPRRDRPLMAIDPSQVKRYAHGSRVPGWDDSVDLTKDPAVVPDPATTHVPAHVRDGDRGADGASTRTSARPSIPAMKIVQREHGWLSPTAMEQAACVLRLTPAYLVSRGELLRHVRAAPQGRDRRVRVHEHLVLAARRGRDLRARCKDVLGGDPDFNVRAFECLGACEIAPMASVDGVYVGPLDRGRLRAHPRRRQGRRRGPRRTSSWPSARPPPSTGRRPL